MNNIPEGHLPDPKVITIGVIDFDEVLNEKEITPRPNIKILGECKIEVYAGEGSVPHFHMESLNHKFSSCICIFSSHYFSHGGKYRDKLNGSQRKQLNDWLSKINTKLIGNITNWQFIANEWITMNPDCKFPKNRIVSIQPDYTSMENYKDS